MLVYFKKKKNYMMYHRGINLSCTLDQKLFSSLILAGHCLPLFEEPPGFSLSSIEFDPWEVLSWDSFWCFSLWEAVGEFTVSGDSGCHGGLSAAGFSRSLAVSFFGLISLTKALAPIQWFFLMKHVLWVRFKNTTWNILRSLQLC